MTAQDLILGIFTYAGGFLSGVTSYRLLLASRAKKGRHDG